MITTTEKPYVVGIDIGGTNTVLGVVDARGTILGSSSIKTGVYAEVTDYIDASMTQSWPSSIRSEGMR